MFSVRTFAHEYQIENDILLESALVDGGWCWNTICPERTDFEDARQIILNLCLQDNNQPSENSEGHLVFINCGEIYKIDLSANIDGNMKTEGVYMVDNIQDRRTRYAHASQ